MLPDRQIKSSGLFRRRPRGKIPVAGSAVRGDNFVVPSALPLILALTFAAPGLGRTEARLWLAPLSPGADTSSASSPLTIENADGTVAATSGGRSLFSAVARRAMFQRDGTLRIMGQDYPRLETDRWGYPDQVVFGRIGARLLGLKVDGGVRDPEEVLTEFNRWAATLDTQFAAPAWDSWVAATLRPVAPWDHAGSLALASVTARGLSNAVVEVAPRADGALLRTVAFDPVAKRPRSIAVTVRPRSANAPEEPFTREAAPPDSRFFRFTTPRYAVRVELTPPLSDDAISQWCADFAAALESE